MEASRTNATGASAPAVSAEPQQSLQTRGLQTVKKLRTMGIAKYAGGTALLSGGVAAVGGAALLGASAVGVKLGALGVVFKVLGLVTFTGLALNPFGAGVVCGLLILAGLYLAYKGYKSRQEGKGLASGDLTPVLKGQIKKEGEMLAQNRSVLSKVDTKLSAHMNEMSQPDFQERIEIYKTMTTRKPVEGEDVKLSAFRSLSILRDRREPFSDEMREDFKKLENFFDLKSSKTELEDQIDVLTNEISELQAISDNQNAIDETRVTKSQLALIGGASAVAGLGLSVVAGVGNVFALSTIGVAAANAGKSALLNVGQFFAWMV